MIRDYRHLRLPILSFLPWAILQLWPGSLLVLSAGPISSLLVPLVSLAALLLAAGGAASLLARLDRPVWLIAILIPAGALARMGMAIAYFGPVSDLLRSAVTVVLLGATGRVAISIRSGWGETALASSGRTPSAQQGASRGSVLRDRSKRVLAVLMACPYLLLVPFLVLYLVMGVWGESAGTYGLTLGVGSLWILGLPGLAIFYALRPFRFGFLLVAVLSLGPAAYGGWAWYVWEWDPEILHNARNIAERYVEDPIHADTEDLTMMPDDPSRQEIQEELTRLGETSLTMMSDERLRRHTGRALLDHAERADDDESRARIATGLMAVGQGRRAEAWLWELMKETEGDPERAALHALVQEAYGDVWGRRGSLGMLWALWRDDERVPVIDEG